MDWAVQQAKLLASRLRELFESPLVKVSRRVTQVDVMLRNFGIGYAMHELVRVINDAGPCLLGGGAVVACVRVVISTFVARCAIWQSLCWPSETTRTTKKCSQRCRN